MVDSLPASALVAGLRSWSFFGSVLPGGVDSLSRSSPTYFYPRRRTIYLPGLEKTSDASSGSQNRQGEDRRAELTLLIPSLVDKNLDNFSVRQATIVAWRLASP